MILNKDENIEKTKSKGEAKREEAVWKSKSAM